MGINVRVHSKKIVILCFGKTTQLFIFLKGITKYNWTTRYNFVLAISVLFL